MPAPSGRLRPAPHTYLKQFEGGPRAPTLLLRLAVVDITLVLACAAHGAELSSDSRGKSRCNTTRDGEPDLFGVASPVRSAGRCQTSQTTQTDQMSYGPASPSQTGQIACAYDYSNFRGVGAAVTSAAARSRSSCQARWSNDHSTQARPHQSVHWCLSQITEHVRRGARLCMGYASGD